MPSRRDRVPLRCSLNGDDGDDLFLAKDGSIDTLNGGAGTDRSRLSATPPERDSNDVLNNVEDYS